MTILSKRAIHYTRAWLGGPIDFVEEEMMLDRDGLSIPATIMRPRHAAGPLPGWVVLHGITRPGRAHKQLVRFTRTLISTGAVAIVPEVPEWMELRLSPHLATPTVRAGVRGLRESGWVRDDPVAAIGFSFGAPHAIAAAADPALADEIGGVVGFGGYCDLATTFHFLMTGEHEWADENHIVPPDPYGRWIVAANYLAQVPDHTDAGDVAAALRELALYSGDIGAPSWEPIYDPVIQRLREGVAEERGWLYDLFAPTSDSMPDRKAASEIAEGLAAAARRLDPSLDPSESLAQVQKATHILHGRNDRLIPSSEAPKLGGALPADAAARVTITRLFGHAARDPTPSLLAAFYEIPRFTRALSEMLAIV